MALCVSFGKTDCLNFQFVGGSFGSGRRGNFLSTFHLGVGVRDPLNPDALPLKFKTFCRVGSGYTDTQLSKVGQFISRLFNKIESNFVVGLCYFLRFSFSDLVSLPFLILHPLKKQNIFP